MRSWCDVVQTFGLKRAPYGVRTRVRGSDGKGFIVEYSLYANRVPWCIEWHRAHDPNTYQPALYDSLSEANGIALRVYEKWVRFYEHAEACEAAEALRQKTALAEKKAAKKFLKSLHVVSDYP